MDKFTYEIDGVTVVLFRKHDDGHGNTLVDYEVSDSKWDGPNPIFTGTGFKPSAMRGAFSEHSALDLLAFFVLQPGDTDPEYFEKDTPEQARWRATNGLMLQPFIEDREEAMRKAEKA